jgi:tetratricopeptide (TPR) repeat protein
VAQPTALIPDTVQAVLAARIDHLPPVEKRLLQTAAVIGHEVPLRLLRVIAELQEEVLQRGLAHLQAGEFLYETCLAPDLAYMFKHALTHEVAYNSLLQERRRTLHARIADAHALAARALGLIRERKARGNEAWTLRLLGDIARHGDYPQVQQAETHYRQALALADEIGMRPLQAHCHLGLGTLYAKIDQRKHAREELSTAIELYRAMDMTFWLSQAEAALAQVQAP